MSKIVFSTMRKMKHPIYSKAVDNRNELSMVLIVNSIQKFEYDGYNMMLRNKAE